MIALGGAGKLHGDERVAEERPQRVEARADEAVVTEPQTHHLTTVGGPLGDRECVVGRQVEVALTLLAGDRQRQRRLREHGRHHHLVDHHAEREPSAEAHADRADPRAAAVVVERPGQRPQPRDDRRRLVQRPQRELTRDAQLANGARCVQGADRSTGSAEQRRHHHGETRIDDVVGEGCDLGGDPGNLVDHNDPGSRPPPKGRIARTTSREGIGAPAIEDPFPVVCAAHRNRPTAASARSASASTPTRNGSMSTT